MDDLEWIDDHAFRIGGVMFRLSIAERFRSTSDNFLLVKHRHMVERYCELLARLQPARMVELGMFEGGSAAMLSLLADPERFVALDLRSVPIAGLEAFIDEHGLRDRVHTPTAPTSPIPPACARCSPRSSVTHRSISSSTMRHTGSRRLADRSTCSSPAATGRPVHHRGLVRDPSLRRRARPPGRTRSGGGRQARGERARPASRPTRHCR